MSDKIVCVDLDGIIIKYDGWKGPDYFGEVRKNARWGLHKLKEFGYDIVVWTTRGNSVKVADFLREEQIPFDYVNHHPHKPKGTSGKQIADVYIDDRALGCPTDWSEIIKMVEGELEE